MRRVDFDRGPGRDPQRLRAALAPEREELVRREHAAATGLPPCDPFELAQLLEGIDPDVRIRSDAESDRATANALGGQEPVPEICFGRRAGTDRRAIRREEIELDSICVRCVDDGGAGAEAAGTGEELDRAAAVLSQALLDLLRLLVRMHVQGEAFALRVRADLAEPIRGARSYGVRCEPDCQPSIAQGLDLCEVRRDGLLPEAGETTASIGDVQQDERETDGLRCLGGSLGLVEAEVVELADGRVPGGTHLAIGRLVRRPDELGRLALRFRQHRLAPGPEVTSRAAPAQCTLERMAVGVDEAGQDERVWGHEGATLTGSTVAHVSWSEVRSHVPNAFTILRFAAIPVFVVLLIRAGDGPAWGAGVFFAGAAATDQLDGYLARRWRVESPFGKVADPLADRLMIVTAIVSMWATGRIPLLAALIVLGRDALLVAGYKLVVPRGYAFDITFLGKAATWALYAALSLVLVTEEGTVWPLALLWLGIVLALVAAVQYIIRARRELALAGRDLTPDPE